MNVLNSKNAVYVLYAKEGNKGFGVYLTEQAEEQILAREVRELGTLISVHHPTFEGVDEDMQRQAFDMACRMDTFAGTGSARAVLEKAFLIGYLAARLLNDGHGYVHISPEDSATD
jgi:hypothetical protein